MTSKEAETLWFVAARNVIKLSGKIGYPITIESNTFESDFLSELLGFKYRQTQYWRHIPLTPELEHTLRQACGPHALTILKARLARLGK